MSCLMKKLNVWSIAEKYVIYFDKNNKLPEKN